MARILIADDRESMRMAVKTVIRMHPGWEVCGEAGDGREAVTKALELRPDLVLLDFRMPITNGIKAGSAICSTLPRTPVVMYTLHRTEELEVAAKLVGIRQVVAKEEGPRPLLSAIEAELGNPEPTQSACGAAALKKASTERAGLRKRRSIETG